MNGPEARRSSFAPGRGGRGDAGRGDAEPRTVALRGSEGTSDDVLGAAAAADAWVPPSWEDVVRDHGNRVYRLAYRLTGNAHDAEDLTQDVFVRVFRSLADYTPGTFEGWLHRITTNLFLDRMRRQQKIRFDALPDDTERLAGREASPEAVYAETHLDADIEVALAALPPDFRAAVVLCDIEQLSYEEIAQTLGVKLGTVRSRISRGRAMLRAALADRAPRSAGAGAAEPPGDAASLAVAAVAVDGTAAVLPAGPTPSSTPSSTSGPDAVPLDAAPSATEVVVVVPETTAPPARQGHHDADRRRTAGPVPSAAAGPGTSRERRA